MDRVPARKPAAMTKQILSPTSPTVYFDNCVVAAVVKGDHPAQMPALAAPLREHEPGTLLLAASTEVLGEIRRLPTQYQGPHLTVLAQLRRLPGANVAWIDETAPSGTQSTDEDYEKPRHVLPDEIDRRHIVHAIKNRGDYFATVDNDPISKHRTKREAMFPLKFATPTQIVTALKLATT